jgi:DNA-binding transcriptional LysR family regulator
MMEIRQLRYFVAVAEDRHFRRAAQRLHVAQPAVSEQIRKLERELGARLLDRTSRSVELTPAGAAFIDDARRILRDVDGAGHVVRRAQAGSRWRLRLGFTLHALPPAIGTVLGRIRTADAHIDVDLASGPARTLLTRLRHDQLDAAIVCLPAPTAGLRVATMSVEPLVAVVPSSRATAHLPVSVARVAAGRVLLPARDADPACHDATLAAFHAAGAAPNLVESAATTVEQLLLEVLAGAGTALLPASAASRTGLPGLAALPLADVAAHVSMGLVTRDEAPGPILTRLLDELTLADEAVDAAA